MNFIYFMTWVNDRRKSIFTLELKRNQNKASKERKCIKQTRLIDYQCKLLQESHALLLDSISILQLPADFYVVDFTAV